MRHLFRKVKFIVTNVLNKINELIKVWKYCSHISQFIVRYMSLVIAMISLIVAIITFYLQLQGNKNMDLINKEAEKISITQDRIEFFQIKNQVINRIKYDKKISDKSKEKLIEDVGFIFENRYAYIVYKDKTGVFPDIDKYHYKSKEDLHNWFDNLKSKVLKVQFLKESKKQYALPQVYDDAVRQIYIERNIVKKGFKGIGYFWKNNRVDHIPLFVFKIEKIPNNQKFIKLSKAQIHSEFGDVQADYYLYLDNNYIFSFFEGKWFITFDHVDRAYGEHLEIKFVPFDYIKDVVISSSRR